MMTRVSKIAQSDIEKMVGKLDPTNPGRMARVNSLNQRKEDKLSSLYFGVRGRLGGLTHLLPHRLGPFSAILS
jgi:hypothetical protein